MGNFYTNYTLRGPSQAAVATALAGRFAIVTPAQNGCVVVFDEVSDHQDQKVITKLASVVDEPKHKAKYLHTASMIASRELSDLKLAAKLLADALEFGHFGAVIHGFAFGVRRRGGLWVLIFVGHKSISF